MSLRANSVNVSTLCQLGTRKEEAVQEDKDTAPPSLGRSVGSGARLSGTRQGEGVRQQDNETTRGNVSKTTEPLSAVCLIHFLWTHLLFQYQGVSI